MRVKLTALAAAFALLQTFGLPGHAKEVTPVISVEGEAVVTATPDKADIRIGVEATAKTAAEAMAQNAASMAKVNEILKAAGIAGRDLQTSRLSVSPEHHYPGDNRPRELIGYKARNVLNVQMRDLAGLGALLDQVVAGGANTIEGLTFGLTDDRAARDEVRVAAVKEARRRAEMMAAAEGVKLGRVLEIREGSSHGGQVMMAARGAMMEVADSLVEAGELEFHASVSLQWELLVP